MNHKTPMCVCLAAALFSCCLTLTAVAGSARPLLTGDAETLHWAAWDELLDAAEDMPEARYAPYAFRSLAVRNPEIYLKADLMFSELLGQWPGTKLAYQHPNPLDVHFYWDLRDIKIDGPSFSWKLWAVVPDSTQDTESDLKMNWLDRRLPPVGILLKSFSHSLRTAEAALMRYVQKRSLGVPEGELFIVIDREGRGYLVEDGGATLGGLRGREADLGEINPVLVFNERAVYYPLFGRDDRGSDEALRRLLDQLGSPATLSLSTGHLRRVSRLRTLTAFPTAGVRQLATLAATGIRDTDHPGVVSNWDSVWFEQPAFDISCTRILTDRIFHAANRLSRYTVELAVAVPDDSLAVRFQKLQDDYLSLCGREAIEHNPYIQPVEAWGNLWAYGLLELSIDDVVRTRAGPPSSQALAMAAVLDMLEIDYVIVEGLGNRLEGLEQQWLYTEEQEFRFDLGNWIRTDLESKRVLEQALPLTACRFPGDVAIYFGRESTCADRGTLSVINGLNRLVGYFAEYGIAIRYRGRLVRRAGFMNDLALDRIPITTVSWPDAGGK